MDAFEDKVAIVTGAGSGIGRATAELYARRGAAVVVSDIDEESGAETVHEIESDGGRATFVRADVSKPEDCESLADAAVEHFGRLDIACNNAGIGGANSPTADYGVEDWQQVTSVNLSGVFYSMKYEIPRMLETGGGAIVNMASILGQVGFENSPAYVAAKHGVVGLTKTAALEYADQDIRVNAVGPAFISTPLLENMDEEARNGLVALHPAGRLGEGDEVAELVAFLSSDAASFTNGAYYPVDGGYLAQ